MNTVKEKWPEIIEHLRVEQELSNVSFNTWIQPLKVYDVVDNTVFILVNMNASVEYIEKKYQLPLKVCIAETTGTEYDVVFISEDVTRYENEGILHVALISRGNEALVTELLQRQTDILNELYLVPEESLFETNAEDYMESEESPSEEETALPEESQETTSEADEKEE